MRRFFEDLREGRYALPRRVKRIAQSLVDLSEGSTPAFLGVTEARNANHDEAGRAVNAAILAVAIARELTDDRTALAHVAMAAMLRDAGRPRAVAIARGDGPAMTGVVAKLSEDAEDRLAAGTAAVLTTLGRVNEATITRTVVAYEALWLRRAATLGPLYRGLRGATLQAKIVALAHRYNDLLTPEPGLPPPSADFAIGTLWEELKEPSDRTVLRMLVSALGFYPTGTVVQLSTGEVAEVVGGAASQRVRLVMDANGGVIDRVVEIDLARPASGEAARTIVKVLSVDGWKKGVDAASPPSGSASIPPAGGEPSGERVSGPSYPSFGTSPSRVGEAFGRVANERPRAPAPPPLPARAAASKPIDRTVVQKSPFEDARDDDERPSIVGAVKPTPQRDPLEGLTPMAKGTLASTPVVHTLVYVLDHGLSGTVVFREPDGSTSMVRFSEGAPTQAKMGRAVSLLGDELVNDGVIGRDAIAQAIASARRLGVHLGEYLVGNDLLTPEALTFALSRQLRKKIASIVNAAPETEYEFYDGVNALEHWGGGQAIPCHPLDAILACVRAWHDRARVHATLGRIGRQPLALHADVDLSVLSLTAEEEAALAILRVESPSLQVLLKSQIGDEDAIGSLVYMLAVTRQFAFSKSAPMGRGLAALAIGNEAWGERVSTLPLAAVVEPSSSRERPRAEVERVVAAHASTWRPPKPAEESAHDEDIEVEVELEEASLPPRAAPSMPPPRGQPTPSMLAPAVAYGERASSLPEPRASSLPEPRASSVPEPRASSLPERRTTSTAALEAMTDFRLAETALHRSDLGTAERFAAKAFEGDPSQPDHAALLIWIRAARATSAAGTADAIDGLTKVLRENPMNERTLLYRGKLYKRARKMREALRDFEAVLAGNPKHSEAASEARLIKTRLR